MFTRSECFATWNHGEIIIKSVEIIVIKNCIINTNLLNFETAQLEFKAIPIKEKKYSEQESNSEIKIID